MKDPGFCNRLFQEMMTELKIGEAPGIFFALYQDNSVIETVSGLLKESLPDYFILPFEIDSKGAGFSAILEREMGAGKKCSIFHVIEVESPAGEFRTNFVDYLQYIKERFRDKPYSLVFWVTPGFEKQLFYSFPDFHHRVTATYDFTKINLNEENAESVKSAEEPTLDIDENIAGYLKKVIGQYENWGGVQEGGKPFLIEAMGRADLKEYYANENCLGQEGEERALNDVVGDFISDGSKTVFTLAGDAESGKTSFAVRLFIDLAKKFLAGGEHIPVFIPLEDYSGKIDIKDVIRREFYERSGIGLSPGIFQELAIRGKFVFIADGFEKMASNLRLIAENLKTLFLLSFEKIKTEKKKKANKIILTIDSKNVFIRTAEGRIRKEDCSPLFMRVLENPGAVLVRLRPKIFDEKLLGEYIVKSVKNEKASRELLKIADDRYHNTELASHSLLSDMILKALPVLKNETEINIAGLFRAYTGGWIEKDDESNNIKPAGKRAFLWQVATKMFKSGGHTLDAGRIEKPAPSHLKKNCICRDAGVYRMETVSCPFLNIDEKGKYGFVHKSFMEYFLAEYYFDSIIHKRSKEISYTGFNKSGRYFLKAIIVSNRKRLRNTDLSSLSLENAGLGGADLSGAKLQRTLLNGSDLASADLREANLTRTNLRDAKMKNAILGRTKLVQADLTNACLRGADITEGDLQRARLNDTDLTGASLGKARLNDADLTNANLEETCLVEADLRWVNLQRARFKDADLSGASLLRANLNDTEFYRAKLERANLGEADLTRADFSGADLNWANLSKANMSESNFSTANLNRANLQKANIQRADFTEVNLKKANLIKADMRWANLRGADLTGADLWQANLNEADLTDAVYDMNELEKGYIEGAKLE